MWRKKISFSVVINSALICSLALSLTACRKDVETKENDTPATMLVEVLPVKATQHQITVQSQGLAQPKTETQLVSEVAGVIKHMSPEFIRGGIIQQKDVLLSLDSVNYHARVRRAEANLATQKTRLAEEEARAKTEIQSWKRSGRSLSSAPDLVLRKPYIQEIKANIKAATAELQQARSDLEKTQIKAPYQGIISERLVNVGQYVTVGTPLGTAFSLDAVEVRLPLSRKDLDLLGIPVFGQFTSDTDTDYPVTLRHNNHTWQAHIIRSEGFQDQQTRLHYVIAEVKDPYGLMKKTSSNDSHQLKHTPLVRGAFVEAEIAGKTLDNIIAIPRKLLRRANQVLIVDTNNKLALKSVTPLYFNNDTAYLSQGLKDHDRLVITAIQTPIVGTEVRVYGQDSDSAPSPTPLSSPIVSKLSSKSETSDKPNENPAVVEEVL